MKNRFAVLCVGLVAVLGQHESLAQGTAFMYQGRLNSGGNPASGSYDLTFKLFPAVTGGSQTGSTLTNLATAVNSGLFMVTLDFGPNVFNGSNEWLEIAVRTNGTGSFSTLTPRQPIDPVPYAITAEDLAPVVEYNTLAPGDFATLSGGQSNLCAGTYATLAGGANNNSTNYASTVSGGWYNASFDSYATVGGGFQNYSYFGDTIGGGVINIAAGTYDTIGGGYDNNTASAYASTVAGGFQNQATADYTSVGGGEANVATAYYAAVGGGYENSAVAYGAFVGGGGYNGSLYAGNYASGEASVIDGGLGNTNTGNYSSICGGAYNYCWVNGYETILGGSHNYCSGDHATICGGNGNLSAGYCSFAAGKGAQAVDDGSFVWCDTSGATTYSTAVNQFMVRASGGFVFYTGTGSGGAQLTAGATSWSALSDRAAKKDIRAADCQQVLSKLAQVPMAEWRYKWDDESGTPNLGPMAQDFKHTFYPGRDDKTISTLEFDGVELAAIVGLNQKLEASEKIKDAKIADLEKRLGELEQAVSALTGRK